MRANEPRHRDDRCDCEVIHEAAVDRARDRIAADRDLYELADLFKLFGDSTRIRILAALREAELCVCDLAVLLNMTRSAVSHQLRSLRQTHLVRNRREGKIVFYSLADDHVERILDQGFAHVHEAKPGSSERRRPS